MITSRSTRRLFSLCVVVASTLPAKADWPFARGKQSGVGVAPTAIADNPAKIWEFKVEDAGFEATAVIASGVVYVGDNAGGLHAMKLEDGSTVWSKAFEETGFTTAGAISGDKFYSVDFDGLVRCHRRDDGGVVWEFATESEVFAGPIVQGGALLVTTEGGQLVALDAATGAERWRFAIDSPLRCSPTVYETASGNAYTLLAGCDGKLHAVDLAGGEEVASVDIGGPTGSSAAVVGRRAYFGTESGEFYAVDIQADGGRLTGLEVAWTYRDPRRSQGIRTAPAVSETAVIYSNQGKAVYALSPAGDKPLWTNRLRKNVESSPVIAGRRAIVPTGRGRLLLLDLETGEEVWGYDAGGSFVASPATAEGRVVIGNTDGVLYCFGKK